MTNFNMLVTMMGVRVQHTDPSQRVDISKFIEMIRRNEPMLKQLKGLLTVSKPADKRDKGGVISFCESCGKVCGNGCRSEALLDQAKEKSTSYQTGLTLRF